MVEVIMFKWKLFLLNGMVFYPSYRKGPESESHASKFQFIQTLQENVN